MTLRVAAKESVGYQATWRIGQSGVPVDLTGWTFALVLARQAGTPDVTLGMTGVFGPTHEGFFVINGPAAELAVNILSATLAGIADTTGDFLLQGDLLGTPPGSSPQFVKLINLRVRV